MSRRKKDYMLSENSIEYISEVKEENNLKYNSDALELIIREHKSNSDAGADYIIKYISESIKDLMKSELKKIKIASNNSDKNTEILIELLNGFFVKSNLGKLATTDMIESEAVKHAREKVIKRTEARTLRKYFEEIE